MTFDRERFLQRLREQFHDLWVPGSHYYSGVDRTTEETDCPICARILLAALEAAA